MTQVDANTGEEKFSLTIPDGSKAMALRPVPLSPVALADVLPPLEASVVAGAHTSTVHAGSEDRPTVAVAFNRPVVDFDATSSVTVDGASVEEVAALVESGAPANAYVFTLAPGGDADIDFRLVAGNSCDTDPAGVCAADGTTLTAVPTLAHTLAYTPPPNSQPNFGAGETGARSVDENTEAGQDIGAAIAAFDADSDTLVYEITGADAAAFDLDTSTGQLRAKAPLDHETKDSYLFEMSVSDGKDADAVTDTAVDDTIDVTVTVSDVNEPPVISGLSEVSYDEGGTGDVTSYEATDPDGDNISWSRAGTDSDDLEIDSSGNLTFTASPNYENPTDDNADNDYLVTVNASDGQLTTPLPVTVTVDNIEEPGTLALSSTQPQVDAELVTTLTDPDGDIRNRSWSWQRSQNKTTWITITGAGAGSYTPSDADIDHYLRVRVSYEDGHGTGKNAEQASVQQTRPAPITNNAPSFANTTTNRSVAENSPRGTSVGAPVTATDPDNDPLTYRLVGADADSFTIDNTGQIRVGDGTTLDHEVRHAYTVTVTATDPSDTSDSITVAITVTNVNEPPVTTTSGGGGGGGGGTGGGGGGDELPPRASELFSDVSAGSWYENAVSWMILHNVTSGCATNMFCPDANLTRQQFVTFLWRAAGKPTPPPYLGSEAFTDVQKDVYAEESIGWAVANGLTKGCTPGQYGDPDWQFCPTQPVTRGQMATFPVPARRSRLRWCRSTIHRC